MTTKKKTQQTFAGRLNELMELHDPPLAIKELADALKISYEHSRKIVRGIVVPTRFLVLALAQLFGVDAAELEDLAKSDQFRRKYGDQAETPIFNPEVAPFATAWSMLSDHQKSDLLERLKKHLSANKAHH